MLNRWVIVAALAAVSAVLGGCIMYVEDSKGGEGWEYREGSALKLVVRPSGAGGAGGAATTPDGGAPIVGTWTGEGTFAQPPVYSQRYYAMEIRDGLFGTKSRRTEVRSLDDVEGLPTVQKEFDERHVTLRLRRDAGAIVLEGEKEGTSASGNVRFEMNETYAANVTTLAGRTVEVWELAALALANVKRTDIEDLRAVNLTMPPEDLIRMKDNGVSGEFMRELAESGRTFTLDEAIKLRSNGVTPEYVRELREAGLDASIPEITRLKSNDVNTGFVRALRSPEGTLPSVDEIVRLRNSGVSAKYIAELRAAGYSFTTSDVIKLSHNSVSSEYARVIREAGYDLSADELIRLRNNGVSSQYVKDLQDPGYEKLTIEQIVQAKNKGLSADFVRTLRKRE